MAAFHRAVCVFKIPTDKELIKVDKPYVLALLFN